MITWQKKVLPIEPIEGNVSGAKMIHLEIRQNKLQSCEEKKKTIKVMSHLALHVIDVTKHHTS